MKQTKIILGATVIVLLVFISCGKKYEKKQKQPQVYSTSAVELQDAELQSVYPATLKGKSDIDIRPRIDGFIEAIYVDEGAFVRKGQVLFNINSPLAEQNVTTAEANVKSAAAQVNTANTNVLRLRPLAQKGIISSVQLTMAEDSYQTALSGLAQAEAALKNAKAMRNWTNVSSPVDGVISSIPYRIGSLVNSSNVLTTVANTSNVFAYFSLNEKELESFLNSIEGKTQQEKIKKLPDITLTLANGNVYPEKGRIETISGTINVTTGSAVFRAEFPNKQGALRSGTSGKVSIPYHLKNVFVIPQKATIAQQDKVLVYVVNGDTVSHRVISVLSTPDGKSYVVTNGLKAGERIVTEGVATLSNGAKIKVQ